jgi:hypothetical protein
VGLAFGLRTHEDAQALIAVPDLETEPGIR